MAGLLLGGAPLPLASQAAPLDPDAPLAVREAPHLEGSAAYDADRGLSVIGEAAQEVRRTGPGVKPSVLGIDEAFLNEGSLLHNEQLRDEISLPWTGRSGPVRNADIGPHDLFKETIHGALRATRDALFEGGDTASFSVAGIDLSVTLRGDRRGVSVNGYDLLASNQYASPGSDVLPQAAAAVSAQSETTVRQFHAEALSDRIGIEDVRRFFSDPVTIVVALAVLGIWIVLAAASSRARGN
jgi:hypothetical protein